MLRGRFARLGNPIANRHDPVSKCRTEAYTLDGRGRRGPVIRDGVSRWVPGPGQPARQSSTFSPAARTSTVFVTAPEENGAPVVDLVADDFTIKEDGKSREVLKAELAHAPVQIAIIVDDNGTGIFRAGLVSFVRLMQGRGEMTLSTVVGQTQRLVDYTTDVDRLATAIVTLTARPGTQDGGQLLEGIFQAAREQEKRDAARPVIVVVTVGGEEHSTLPAHHVLDQLAKSGTTLYVITVANNTLSVMRPIDKPSALLEENLNLSEVLGEGPKQTGGWREVIVAAPGITLGLQRLAAELKTQYAVAYAVRRRAKHGAAGGVDKQARRAVARTEQSAGAAEAGRYFLSKTAFCSGVISRRLSTFAVITSRPFSSTSQV